MKFWEIWKLLVSQFYYKNIWSRNIKKVKDNHSVDSISLYYSSIIVYSSFYWMLYFQGINRWISQFLLLNRKYLLSQTNTISSFIFYIYIDADKKFLRNLQIELKKPQKKIKLHSSRGWIFSIQNEVFMFIKFEFQSKRFKKWISRNKMVVRTYKKLNRNSM
jgi:hypothetical protein